MNAALLKPDFEPRWRTYSKSAVFLAPPIFVWAISCVFVFPKLKQIWRDAGFADSMMMGFLQTSDFFLRHGALLCVAVIGFLVLMEWRNNGWWPRHRRAWMGLLVFLLNSAVLFLIMAMLCSAIVAAPALARLK